MIVTTFYNKSINTRKFQRKFLNYFANTLSTLLRVRCSEECTGGFDAVTSDCGEHSALQVIGPLHMFHAALCCTIAVLTNFEKMLHLVKYIGTIENLIFL